MEKLSQIPEEILVRRRQIFAFFESSTAALGIRLIFAKELAAVRSARNGMERHLESSS